MDMRKSVTRGDVSSRLGVRGHDGHHRAPVRESHQATAAGPRSRRGRWGRLARIGLLALTGSLAAPPASGTGESPAPLGEPTEAALEVRTVTYGNGDHYEGEWQDNAPHGRGSYAWANGDRYDGEWQNGRIHGEGTYVWTDGTHYSGSWRDGLRHGAGTFSWADGDRMHSEWDRGTRQVARAECLTVERTSSGTTLWVNRCHVGVDVLWRDEGACGSTDIDRWPCSWYVGPHESAQAAIEGQVWWRECKSPGGLGDVVAAEKEDGAVYCMDDAGLRTLARTRRKRQHAESSELAAEASRRAEQRAPRAGHHR